MKEYRFICVIFGVVFFFLTNRVLRLLRPVRIVCSRQAWKWNNAANSLLHSLITGIGALYCLYEHPAMAEDLISGHTSGSLHLASFSLGYFMYDFYDMARHHRKRSSYELMAHHACVIVCFGLAVVSQLYVGYAIVALLVEVNSIFLHYRQLLIVRNVSRECRQYRLTALVNIATFLVFRIAVLGWMTRWLVLHREVVPRSVYTLGSVAMSIVVMMNIILFLRIFIVDFVRQRKPNTPEAKAREEAKTDQKGSLRTTNSTAIYALQATMPGMRLGLTQTVEQEE